MARKIARKAEPKNVVSDGDIADDQRRAEAPQARDEELDEIGESTPLALDELEEDGGNPQHPIHDDDVEDLESEDYEELADEAQRGKLERRTADDDAFSDPEHEGVFSEGSGDPLDNRDSGESPFKRKH
jgi:hypothetical protein